MARHKRMIYRVGTTLLLVGTCGLAWSGPVTHRIVNVLLSHPIVTPPAPASLELTRLWLAAFCSVIAGLGMAGIAVAVLLPQNRFYVTRAGRVMHSVAGVSWTFAGGFVVLAAALTYGALHRVATSQSPDFNQLTSDINSYESFSRLGFTAPLIAGILVLTAAASGFRESSPKAGNVLATGRHKTLIALSVVCVLGFVICVIRSATTAQFLTDAYVSGAPMKPNDVFEPLLAVVRSSIVAGVCMSAFGLLQVLSALMSPRDVDVPASS